MLTNFNQPTATPAKSGLTNFNQPGVKSGGLTNFAQKQNSEQNQSIGDIAWSFAKNLPTSIARTIVQPAEYFAKTLGSAASFVGERLATKLNQQVFKVSDETKQKLKNVQKEASTPFKFYGQDEVLFDPTPYKSTKEFIGGTAEAALNSWMALASFGTANILKGTAEAAGKTALEVGGKALAEKAAVSVGRTAAEDAAIKGVGVVARKATKSVAQTIITDAALGASFGAATAAQEKDSSALDIAKAAGLGAVFGVAAPKVLGFAGKKLVSGIKLTGAVSNEAIDKIAASLEKRVAEGSLRPEGLRPYEAYAAKPETAALRLARKTAETLRVAQRTPLIIEQAWNKTAPLKLIERAARKVGVQLEENDLQDLAQRNSYVGHQRVLDKFDELKGVQKNYADVWDKVKEQSMYLDALARIKRTGKAASWVDSKGVEHLMTTEIATKALDQLALSVTPEQLTRIMEGQQVMQAFLVRELEESVAAGTISKAEMEAMRATNPDYLPHDILDFLEEKRQTTASGKKINVTQSGFNAAEGSTRKIADVDTSIARYITQHTLINENNKTATVFAKSFKQIAAAEAEQGATPTVKVLRSAENVRARQEHYAQIKQLGEQINALEEQARFGKRFTREEKANIATLKEKFKIEEDSFYADLAAYQGADGTSDDITRLYEQAVAEQEKKQAFNEFSYPDPEMEKGYQKFKKVAARRKWMQDSSTDVATLEKKLTDRNVFESFFAGGTEKFTDDELLSTFQDRYAREVAANKAPSQAGVLRKIGQKGSRLSAQEARLTEAEQKLAAKMGEVQGAEISIDNAAKEVEALQAKRAKLFDDAKALRDFNIKEVDYKKQGFEKVSHFEDGIQEHILVPRDVGRAMKNLNGEQAQLIVQFLQQSKFGRFLTAPARATRAISTTFNPVFAYFTNPIRDIQGQQILAEAGPRNYVKGLLVAMGHSEQDIATKQLLESVGGFQSNIYNEGKSIEEIVQKKFFAKQSRWTKATDVFRHAAEAIEQAPRIAVGLRALENGSTLQEAAKIMRNASVDFGKGGYLTDVLNKVIPFFNARTQGAVNIAGSFAKDPERFFRRGMWSAAFPAVVLYAHNDRYTSYQSVPDSEKRKYWVIMVGESRGIGSSGKPSLIPHYLRIPKGEVQASISNLMERTLNFNKKNYPQQTTSFLSNLISDFSPVTEASLIPPGIGTAFELKANYSVFRGRNIVPEYTKFGKSSEVQPRYQYTDTNSEIAKAIGYGLNWSPAKIDYVIKTGALNDIIRTFDLALRGSGKPKNASTFEKASELPFLRSIIGTSDFNKDILKNQQKQQKTIDRNTKKIERKLQRERQRNR